ncbi:PREDICTED: LOW QUALITY PROTEIN: leucine-rich repeat serine/threonine-protein kinase 1 [Myotis davidii]|uniref:LOW QUALITY PROTEIN: leucine-rich repeat serine/threonine-protein kinase 1 n=1 Tax=Myotis davidii TaxID=225400 RepID=UPI0007678F1A|nr:PREDICTED: LOW QUALITY PROTEIN: leucine-rich repeat serine/threonine-protein kinase 1 [Myotis davidii]
MAGMSGRPPSMYWCVGPEGSAVSPEHAMDTHNGAGDMGSKLATPDGDPAGRRPGTEDIHAAYKRGDLSRARQLLREACEECASQREKGQLLSIAAAYGDLETVRYLLTERQVELPTEPTDDNPAVVAAHFGHTEVVQELLESFRGPCSLQRLLNWMLALACQRGHLGLVKLLVLTYGADPESYAVRKNEFPVIVRLPLYAAIKAGNEDIAIFLLRHGAFFCSYILLDSPEPSKHLLRSYFIEASALPSSCSGKVPLRVKWAHLRLPWVDIDWLIDISCQITELDLSANCLASLPSVVPWGLINLRKLNLSDNHLGELPGVQSSDEIICSRLLEVDVSSNKLAHLPPGFLHLSKLQKLTASKNYLEKLFEEESATNWIGLRKLQELDVSDNKLTELPATFLHSFKSLHCLNVSRNKLKVFPDAWACPLLPQALVYLKLQGNQLVAVPPPEKWTCTQLKTLDLSRNQFGKNEDGLKTKRISFFTTRGRQRSGTETACPLDFPAFLSESLEVLCLNDNHLDAVPPSVCLLKSLSELYLGNNPGLRELPPELGQLGNLWQLDIEDLNISNVPAEIRKEGPQGIHQKQRQAGAQGHRRPHLRTWQGAPLPGAGDWAGAQPSPGPGGPLSQAKAPNAVVLVVGTHLDLIESKFRVERIATLRAYVLALCRSPSGSRATGFPDISFKHLHEISCKTLEGLEGLRQLIFHVTCNMKDVGSTIGCQRLVGRLVPRSYLSLQEAVLAEHQRRSLSDDVQYLTDRQLEQLVEQTPGNDISDYEDLQSAISFLIETGALLHFPDTSHGLRNLYFLDPIWLSECLQRIFSIKGSRSVAKNGVIRAEDLRLLLVGTGFTQQTEEQYFQFLAKFEIALPVANDSCGAPPGAGEGLGGLTQDLPLSRQLFETKKNSKSRHRKVTIYSFAGTQRNRCSTFRVKRNQTIYWQEGLLVTFDGGYLSVESSDVNWKKKKSGGIKIICQSEVRDFSAMAFITDHVNSLIDQWFPALTATESDGTPLMEQYVPCPVCETSWARHTDPSEKAEGVQYFDMEDCVLTAIERDFIACPRHPDLPVPLQELVPELFMTDFPARLFLENSGLEHSEDESSVLGQGGSGTIIYRARYQGRPVAVKRFQIKKFKNFANVPADTMLRHLRATDAMKNFSEFRQEASMLHALQHPCIVSLIGISIHPLCFALELAPLGSLNTVLSENAKDSSFMPLGHMLTQKTAYQIAAGLAYLHKKNIIFCDLKSDNILVWSLDVKEHVNIKLSDYGISRQSFHEGALGVEGTPGYQAPEIRPRIVYDEKVPAQDPGPVSVTPPTAMAASLPQRPLALSVVSQMKDPTFATFMYQLPCGKQTAFFSSQSQEYTVVFWDGKEESRNYTVVNTEKGLLEVQRMGCPGRSPEPCRRGTPAFSRPFFLFSRQNSFLVLAGLADGLVAAFPVVRGAPEDSCSYLCSHTANRSKFGIPDEDVRQNPYPVAAMVSAVTSLVCSSDCGGEEVVWCLDDRANLLVMYHSATYQLCARYFCGDPNPGRDVFPVRPSGLELPGSDRSEQELSPVDGEAFSQHLQAVKVLAVKDVIWVPRRGGDVIVIGLERDAGAQRGRVIAVLKARELTSRGALVDAAVVAKDTVVCGFEDESSEWCLAVWRGWGTREFDVFFQAYEELGRLEACGRKRR